MARRDLQSFSLDSIHIGTRMRPVADDARVAALAASMGDIGLHTPISLRMVEKVEIDGEEVWHVPVLIAGRNRMEAARRLGWTHIDGYLLPADHIEAQLWEIAENLHRVGLTKEERDVHIRRYAELLKEREAEKAKAGPDNLSHPAIDARGQRKSPQQQPGVAKQIADETGLSQRTVQRVLAKPKIKPVQPPGRALNDEEVFNGQLQRLVSAWNGAGREARQMFVERYIDTPVMDRGVA